MLSNLSSDFLRFFQKVGQAGLRVPLGSWVDTPLEGDLKLKSHQKDKASIIWRQSHLR
jgi:hypothetical protein